MSQGRSPWSVRDGAKPRGPLGQGHTPARSRRAIVCSSGGELVTRHPPSIGAILLEPTTHRMLRIHHTMDTNVFEELRLAILASEEAKEREALARRAVVDFLTESGKTSAKLSWANVSVVTTPHWEYRDGGVTSAKADVAKAETALKQAKALLKGAQDSAKAAGGAKARIIDTVTTLRVARVEPEA